MISGLRGRLVAREFDHIEVETAGGVVYEVQIPLSILERLPKPPAEDFAIRTLQVVREDSVTLYGFVESFERELFLRLLGASGVGPKVALAMLSTYTAHRLAQALVEKDVNALRQVGGVGKKTAERIVLELADKVEDLATGREGEPGGAPPSGVQEAGVRGGRSGCGGARCARGRRRREQRRADPTGVGEEVRVRREREEAIVAP